MKKLFLCAAALLFSLLLSSCEALFPEIASASDGGTDHYWDGPPPDVSGGFREKGGEGGLGSDAIWSGDGSWGGEGGEGSDSGKQNNPPPAS